MKLRLSDKGDKGATLVWVAIMIPMFLAFAALALDLARVELARSRVQATADAASLAGSLAGKAIPKTRLVTWTEPVMDPTTGQPATDPTTGQPLTQTRSRLVIECYHIEIDPAEGYSKAQATWAENVQHWPYDWQLVSWDGYVSGKDRYVVDVKIGVPTVFMGAVENLISGSGGPFNILTFHVQSEARAKLPPDVTPGQCVD